MKLADRVKALEERLEIVEAGETMGIFTRKGWADKLTDHVDVRYEALIKEMLANIQTMKNIIQDLQEHFESHNLDKKKREGYASKRKTLRYKEYTNE